MYQDLQLTSTEIIYGDVWWEEAALDFCAVASSHFFQSSQNLRRWRPLPAIKRNKISYLQFDYQIHF